MGLFNKKPVYKAPVHNDRPIEIRFDIIDDPHEYGVAKLMVEPMVYNRYGAPVAWATFPSHKNFTEGKCTVRTTRFREYVEDTRHTVAHRITEISSNFGGLPNCQDYVKGFIIPDTVEKITGFGNTHVPIILPDGLKEVGGQGLYIVQSLYYTKELDQIANYYEGAWYFGSENNPYLVLICAYHEAERCIIHPNTRIIQQGAFERCFANNLYRNFRINSLVIPASVKYIGSQRSDLYITDVQFEDPDGWYEFDFTPRRLSRTPDFRDFSSGLKKKN